VILHGKLERTMHYKSAEYIYDLYEKVAGRAYLKNLRRLARRGDIAAIEREVARLHAAGKLKISPQGTQIQHLGHGAEGVGTLVVGAKDAPGKVTVRKAYDRGSALYDKELIGEKHNMLRRAKNHPHVAKVHSSKIRKGRGGTPYTINEYVPGRSGVPHPPPPGNTGLNSSMPVSWREGANLRGNVLGMGQKKLLGDVALNPSNVRTTPAGKTKIIDFLPTTRTQTAEATTGQPPKMKRMRKFMGAGDLTVDPHGPTGAVGAAQQAYIARLQANPAALARAGKVQAPAQIEQFRHQYSRKPQPSDFGPTGALRKADRVRTLRGL